MPNKRISNFQFHPADSITYGFSNNGCKISFGMEEEDGSTTDQVGIFLTLGTAKVLSHLLDVSLSNYENTVGPIPVDQAKLDAITDAILKKPQS